MYQAEGKNPSDGESDKSKSEVNDEEEEEEVIDYYHHMYFSTSLSILTLFSNVLSWLVFTV